MFPADSHMVLLVDFWRTKENRIFFIIHSDVMSPLSGVVFFYLIKKIEMFVSQVEALEQLQLGHLLHVSKHFWFYELAKIMNTLPSLLFQCPSTTLCNHWIGRPIYQLNHEFPWKNIILCSDFIYLINILSTRYFVHNDLSALLKMSIIWLII